MHKNLFLKHTDVTIDWDFDHDPANTDGIDSVDVHPRADLEIIAGIVSERHKISPAFFLENVLAFHVDEEKVSFLWKSGEACRSFREAIHESMKLIGTDQFVDHFDKDGRCIGSSSVSVRDLIHGPSDNKKKEWPGNERNVEEA